MSQMLPTFTEMQNLTALQNVNQQQQQQQQQQQPAHHIQVTTIQPPTSSQTRVRVIPHKILAPPPPGSFNPQQSINIVPATKVAIINSQQHQQQQQQQPQQQIPLPAHTNNISPYIVTFSSNGQVIEQASSNNNANNNNATLINTQQQQQQQPQQFHQLKNLNHIESYQYIDDATGQIVYQSSNDHIQQQGPIYLPQQTVFYSNVGNNMLQQDGFLQQTQQPQQQQQLSSSSVGGKTFILHRQLQDVDAQLITGGPRAAPATVNWLLENYEATEGVSLPRSSLYNHYLCHCDQMKLEPMNQASFGKLIRSVFPQIRTRRLGTRGNSKYHYYGIKIKSTSSLILSECKFADDTDYEEMTKGNGSGCNSSSLLQNGSVHHIQQQHHQPQQLQQQQLQQRIMIDTVIEGAQMSREGINCQQQQFFTDTIVTLPNFGVILVEDGEEIPDGASQKHLGAYEELYAEQCEAIMAGIVNFQFSVIESLWKSFWRTDGQSHDELERTLPCNALYALSKMPSVQKYTMKSDYTFYQSLIGTLIPDVLKPIPSTLTQVIRNFAKNLEGSLRRSMNGICTEMIECKVTAANAFSQTLRRYTSLNHLAQAARAVLQNSAQVTQMLSDLNRVDFSNIQEQAYWVCRCNGDLVKELETDLKLTLEKQSSLEEWVDWLEGVVNLVLTPHEHHVSTFTKVAHQFLLHWSFYSSMVIRDLTLRSAASFGSFHLIRLLFDEYMFFLVEKKVASIAGETTVATVGNKNLNNHSGTRANNFFQSYPSTASLDVLEEDGENENNNDNSTNNTNTSNNCNQTSLNTSRDSNSTDDIDKFNKVTSYVDPVDVTMSVKQEFTNAVSSYFDMTTTSVNTTTAASGNATTSSEQQVMDTDCVILLTKDSSDENKDNKDHNLKGENNRENYRANSNSKNSDENFSLNDVSNTDNLNSDIVAYLTNDNTSNERTTSVKVIHIPASSILAATTTSETRHSTSLPEFKSESKSDHKITPTKITKTLTVTGLTQPGANATKRVVLVPAMQSKNLSVNVKRLKTNLK